MIKRFTLFICLFYLLFLTWSDQRLLAQDAATDALAKAQNAAMNALSRAQNAHSVGDNITALESIWEAQEAIWNLSPLGVRNVAFVTEPPDEFGIYTPKVGEEFGQDELLILYCEPFGYTQIKEADGTYGYSVIASLSVLDSEGQVLGGNDNLGPYGKTGIRTFNTQFMIFITLNMRGLEAGSYVLKVTLTDNNDQTKTVQMEKPFVRLPDPNT
ncbi:MAG: hypothetical protein LBV23_02685 [Deltaproteobacteria bacterium]|jgi:hypothetical protein|nr:hypothetical protein [Deltaproteobacteria bacterium]